MYKQCIVLIIALIICIVANAIILHQSSEQNGLIFTLFRSELQKASDDFYSKYLSDSPSVANYSGKIVSLEKSERGYYIKFGIEPYLGPHYPVGYDEAEYFVDNIGTISLLNFSHKKNYEFPSRLGVVIKKQYPKIPNRKG